MVIYLMVIINKVKRLNETILVRDLEIGNKI